MKYRVLHRTSYFYSEPVSLCHNEVHVTPRSFSTQKCLSHALTITPHPNSIHEREDFFGNSTAVFSVLDDHEQLEVRAESEVQVTAPATPIAELTPGWESVREALRGQDAPRHFEALQYLYDSKYVKAHPDLAAWALSSFTPERPLLGALVDLTRRIFTAFKYDSRATSLSTPVMEVFEKRRGVCQDFAHLQLSMLRSLGLAARYVSGYLLTMPAPGKERLIGADASHAWLSAYCPGFGWIDVDPTNNQIPTDKHILVAWGRDYADISPVKGVILGGGKSTMHVSVDVAAV